MKSPTPRLAALLATSAALLSCNGVGRVHLQHEGSYAITFDQVVRDDCQAAGALAGQLSPLSLSLIGDVVWANIPLYGLQLRGQYLSGLEQFDLDASAANVPATLGGQSCQEDQVNVHLAAVTDSATTFHGTLQVHYATLAAAACNCQVGVTYHAVLQ